MVPQDGIRWPDHYNPSNTPIHVRNEISIPAPPEAVWAWLIRAPLWPNWYPNSANVKFLEGTPTDLALGTRFRWKTFGVTIESKVNEFVPCERLAWDAHAMGLDVYHAWLLTKTTGGCHLLTEETQHGWLARLGAIFTPGRMYKLHQVWLERLAEKAVSGPPAGP